MFKGKAMKASDCPIEHAVLLVLKMAHEYTCTRSPADVDGNKDQSTPYSMHLLDAHQMLYIYASLQANRIY